MFTVPCKLLQRRQSWGMGAGATKGGLEEEANTKDRRCTNKELLTFTIIFCSLKKGITNYFQKNKTISQIRLHKQKSILY